MHSSHLLLEEPIRMSSILEPSKPVRAPISHFPDYLSRDRPLCSDFSRCFSHLFRFRLCCIISPLLAIVLRAIPLSDDSPLPNIDPFAASLQSFFPAMTKIVGTLGPKSRSVEVISACLKAGMSGMFLRQRRISYTTPPRNQFFFLI